MDKFENYIKQSRLVISYAGAGTIETALRFGKPIIVVPRFEKFKESINDHQLQLTEVLAKESRVIPLYEIDKLGEAINKAAGFKPKQSINAKNAIVNIVEAYCKDNFL